MSCEDCKKTEVIKALEDEIFILRELYKRLERKLNGTIEYKEYRASLDTNSILDGRKFSKSELRDITNKIEEKNRGG